jgi:uncharacterized damage-inducible protein DinB
MLDGGRAPKGAAMKELIASLYEYGIWANERLLAKAAKLDPAQLTQRMSKGADPILPTFGHLVGADLRWFARWRGETPPEVSPTDFGGLDVVRQRWEPLYRARRAYIESLDDAALRASMQWIRPTGTLTLPRWQAMVQCANHGTQHRSEIAAMLTDFGHSPGDLDFTIYSVERR